MDRQRCNKKLSFRAVCGCTTSIISFLIIKPTRCTNFLKIILGMKLYMFRTVPLSIIRRFSLYTQQWYMSYRFHPNPARKLSANLYDIYHCCVYSEKLVMDRGTVRNMQSFISRINLRNWCIWLVLSLHIYHDVRSLERQTSLMFHLRSRYDATVDRVI